MEEPLRGHSFVHGVGASATATALVRSMVELAHTLGLRTVAEGEETAQHRDALLAMGCDLMQGYFFGRPAPASAMAARVPAARRPMSELHAVTPRR